MAGDQELQSRKAPLLVEIKTQRQRLKAAKSKVDERKKPGVFRSMISPIKSMTDFSGTGSEIEMKRAERKVEQLQERIDRLDYAATVKSVPEVVDRLRNLRQYIVDNVPLGQGGDMLTMVAAMGGLGDEWESAKEQMIVLMAYGKDFLGKYYKDAASCALVNLDAQIRKHEREMNELSTGISQLDTEGPVLSKGISTPLKNYLSFLQDVNYRLKTIRKERSSTPAKPAAEDTAKQVAAKVHEMAEAVALLEKQCEEDVKKYPEQADAIRRRYRKAMDAILERA